MGNRERLLDGAKQCLYEKGYTRTTARDIASAAGTSLAAIGYHFGSTEALLNEALYTAVGEWGEELGRALTTGARGQGPEGRFTAIWTELIETLPAHRPLWTTQFEALGQVDRMPEVREFLARAQRQGRTELARLFAGDEPLDERASQLLGTVHQALLVGVMAQWLMDPEHAPSAADLAEGLRLLADRLSDPVASRSPRDPG
jgi:AcrR family transcriptional regulator